MDSPRNPDDMSPPSDDLSALAWVHDELRRSLESAHKALRRFLKESDALSGSDVDVVDPAVLRTARQQIHQGVGALELVGLPAAATMLRACEAAVQRFVAKPHKLTAKIVDDLEHASFALLDYLGRVLAGKPVSPLSMFPQYRVVQEAAGADRVHPADLWSVDWRWNALPDAGVISAPRRPDAAARQMMEQYMLGLMRGDSRVTSARMSELCAGLGAGASAGPASDLASDSADLQMSTLWKLAAAAFEAQAEGLLKPDVFSKRLDSRLLAQLRMLEKGQSDVSERLAQDLLFFCAQAKAPNARHPAPRLSSVRAAYDLARHEPIDYLHSPLGKFDPAWLAQARKRVTAAKDSWSAVAGGELHRMSGLAEQIVLVGESLRKLFPAGDTLAAELQQAVAHTQQGKSAPSASLAMEVATGLLYVEASLEDAEFDNPEQASRIRRLAERTSNVRRGAAPEPLEAWMEALYRRVSDRQTMGSVVQELRASLSEAEKRIDQFFRKPDEPGVLSSVPQQLSSMRGVLSVLGMNQASAALVRMRDDVEALATGKRAPSSAGASDATTQAANAPVFARLAGNLGALGFLIDMLSVQPQMAKSLFVYDADHGTLSPVMGRITRRNPIAVHAVDLLPQAEDGLIEQAQMLAFTAMRDDVPLADVSRDLERLSQDASAAEQPALLAAVHQAQVAIEQADDEDALTSARGELSEALVDFVTTASGPIGLDAVAAPFANSAPAASTGEVDLADDDEMREIFLEEAREVLQDAGTARAELAEQPSDLTQMTTLRRAFHTLKGSSRMVGLKAFGDAAWVLEQLYNTRLGAQQPCDETLVDLTQWALDYLAEWVDDIAARRPTTHDAAAVETAVNALLALDATPDAFGSSADRFSSSAFASLGLASESDEPMALPQVDEFELPPMDAAEFALSFPSDLPTAADLDLTSAAPMASSNAVNAADDAPSFDLDLSSFDPPPSTHSAADDRSEPDAPIERDSGKPADSLGVQNDAAFWAHSFDTQPADLPTVPALLDEALVPRGQPQVEVEMIDLDFGVPMPLDETEIHAASTAADAVGESERPVANAIEAAVDTDHDTDTDTDADSDSDTEAETDAETDPVKVVGPLRISIPLFNIYLAEADELSRRLTTDLAEWALELHRPVGETSIALAHSLAGSSATVGFAALSHLSRALEHALVRSESIGSGTDEEGHLFVEVADEIRRLLHQFAAGFLKEPSAALVQRLAEHELSSARRLDAATAAADLNNESASPGDLDLLPDLIDEAELIHLGEFDPAANDSRPVPLSEDPSANEESGASPAHDIGSTDVADDIGEPVDEAAAEAASAPVHDESDPITEFPELEDVPHAGDAPAASVDTIEPLDVVDLGLPIDLPPVELEPHAAAPADAHHAAEPVPAASTRPAPLLETNFDALAQPELKPLEPLSLETLRAAADPHPERRLIDDDIDATDAVDAELFPIFEEEADELLPKLAVDLREWSAEPTAPRHAAGCMRTLHTLKGGARLAGAMRLGELAHRLEGRIEALMAQPVPAAAEIAALEEAADQLSQTFEALKAKDEQAYADAVSAAAEAVRRDAASIVAAATPRTLPPASTTAGSTRPAADAKAVAGADVEIDSETEGKGSMAGTDATAESDASQRAASPRSRGGHRSRRSGADAPIDWSRFAGTRHAPRRANDRVSASQASVRVRAPLLDRLVNQAGEVSITRSRIESEVAQIKGSLADLTENLARLRLQLRDIELQAETQMSSRLEAAKAASQNFDPLEFDRFTRFQELTRMMAESVNDVATVQRTLHRTLEVTEDELVAQARLTRDMQDDLLRTRMVEFESASDRLYRVVRQAAKETGKQVRLDIVGGSLEIDRGVLDRMTGSFEHLLRNSITHGVEMPAIRAAAGKDAVGSIVVSLTHEGNEVGVEFRDDGAGLDLARIRAKAESLGLLAADQASSAAELADMIFTPGFSTADTVTELAGRGVGMDVVRSEVNSMGGRIETSTSQGQGTSFKLVLPLTTAVTQIVMVRIDKTTVAIPSTLIEIVRRNTVDEVAEAYRQGSYAIGDRSVPFYWLGSLLQQSARSHEPPARTRQVLIIRSAQQRIALHVDEVLGNQEAVVKNLGPQLSRMPGLAGITLLASGSVALIYNPVALATLYGHEARQATVASFDPEPSSPTRPMLEAPVATLAPLVLVVDDSLTVRRVTQRLLVREGYRVTLAKDGLDALERLAEEKPAMVLSDIEMPRMDGFDLVRNIRNDERLRDLPVIMITSRIAQKHRDYASQLGVDHYLGKPYSEEDLLALIGRYTAALVD